MSLLTVAGLPPVVAKAWLQSWKWAAITVAVVTSPVIGKVAKVSAERFAGTIAGIAASASLLLMSLRCTTPSCYYHSSVICNTQPAQ